MLLKVAGGHLLWVASNSMYPTLKRGDIIVTLPQSQYHINDIVTYTHNDSIITHRICAQSKSMIKTKGDNNKIEDIYTIRTNDIKGKYIMKISRLIWPFLLFYIYGYSFKKAS